MEDQFLTTSDNPYNPFKDFDKWYAYDEQMGYHTCGLVARFSRTAEGLSDEQNERAIYDAYLEILNMSDGPIGFDDIKYEILTDEESKA